MWIIMVDDSVIDELKSPVAAEMKVLELRRQGYDAYALFDERVR